MANRQLDDCPNSQLIAHWRTYSDTELLAGAVNLCRWVVQAAEEGMVKDMTPYNARGVQVMLDILAERAGPIAMKGANEAMLLKGAGGVGEIANEEDNGKG